MHIKGKYVITHTYTQRHKHAFICICVCIYIYVIKKKNKKEKHVCIYIYIYIYTYITVCVMLGVTLGMAGSRLGASTRLCHLGVRSSLPHVETPALGCRLVNPKKVSSRTGHRSLLWVLELVLPFGQGNSKTKHTILRVPEKKSAFFGGSIPFRDVQARKARWPVEQIEGTVNDQRPTETSNSIDLKPK